MAEHIKIIDTYFRIEAGYNGGDMSKEQHDAFYAEIKKLFMNNGFRYEARKYQSECPDVILGKTRLYCHPQSLSGPVEEVHFPMIEQLLSGAKTFRFLHTDKYKELFDMTPDEELQHYHSCMETVQNDLLTAFKTKRRNLFKLKCEILELVAQKIHLPTIRTPYMSSYTSISKQFVDKVYKDMAQKGLLIEGSTIRGVQTIPLCRAANQKELQSLKETK